MATLKAWTLIMSNKNKNRNLKRKTIHSTPGRIVCIALPEVLRPRKFRDEEANFRKCVEKLSITLDKLETIKKPGPNGPADPLVTAKLHAVLEAVADRVEMHTNVGRQRDNWNSLLLASINSLTLAATGITATGGAGLAPAAMFVAAAALLSAVNWAQPSQLAEEQRQAARLFRQLERQIEAARSGEKTTGADVAEMVEKVLALDRAYPLPLLGGTMLQKFPADVEPARWWTPQKNITIIKSVEGHEMNGWSRKLEEELKQTVGVLRKKDKEEFLRLGRIALKLNKFLAVAGPVFTGLAAVGSAAATGAGGWAAVCGAVAVAVNAVEHGGQVGMVLEIYRNAAGFFEMMGEGIEGNLREEDLGKRENGEVLEMKVALQLGRSLAELRELAADAAAEGEEGVGYGSKLF